MALAICLGVLAGVLGFLPLYGATVAVKHVTSTSNFSHVTVLVLALVGSFVILAGSVIACAMLNRQDILAFVGAEAAGLVVSAIVFGVHKTLRK